MPLRFAPVLLLASATTWSAETNVREVPVAVCTEKGAPVEDLTLEEIEVAEEGEKRTVLSVERDERAVDVALILDSSEWMGGEYRSTLVPAALEFMKALPPEARLTVWTSGGGVSRAVEFGADLKLAEEALKKRAVGGASFALDAVVEASLDLQEQGAERRVVVAVTGYSVQASTTLIERAYRTVPTAQVTPVVVLIKSADGQRAGLRVGGESQSFDVESVLQQMAEGYGGGYDLVLIPLAARKMLKRIAADVSSQYLVRYESTLVQPAVPVVGVGRKKVLVRPGLAMLAH